MNSDTTQLDEFLQHVSPEKREAFLKSRLGLEQRFDGNDELISLALHMDNFASVFCDLSMNGMPNQDAQSLLDNRRLLTENLKIAKEIQKISQDNRLSATVVANVTRFHILCIITGSFLLGGIFLLLIEILCKVKL